ncbi:unnamed protein product [Rotaria magnacalcarata]|uniref:Uncharacterized protein n=1 Tax=Rotaria magnacalcarata TaxID=392030 RepID=A0A816RNQ5_9BILA|nr:unnamed protein product [Rotaria magnacalcarata]CAF2074079.1 unnamed protein product [Rotaria magnacalcarata]CAF4129932.1 unnamed protein product [Rotaria magnacalcarata]CAF4162715.1 unnamed protein product [Rotaria magnacalcarata]
MIFGKFQLYSKSNWAVTLLNLYFTLIGIKHTLTSAYHQRSDNVIEKFNRIFDGVSAKYVGDNDINKLDEYIDRASFCMSKAKLPGEELITIINNDEENNITCRVQQLDQLVQQRDTVHQRLNSNSIKMKIYYDHHLKHIADQLQPDDWILIHNESRKKFQLRWFRPYKIMKFCLLGTYQLEDVKDQLNLDLVHRDMLKRAYFDYMPTQQWYKPSRRKQK